MQRHRIDIVVPLFNEIEIISILHERILGACQKLSIDWRIIYVDDGSTDQTGAWILENASTANDIHLVSLSRNFGQPAAIAAGMMKTSDATLVVVMDGDLQDPPELIPEMVKKWEQGFQVVIPQRRKRAESLLRGIAFKSFHRLFGYLSDSPIQPNTGTFCLMDRQAVAAIEELGECHRFFPGLRSWVGFKQCTLLFDRPPRAGGTPKQTLGRLTKYGMDAIFGYSLKPLRLLTFVGISVCAVSFLLACWFVTKRIIGWESASIGFTTLTCAVFGLGGFQLVGLGILGEYIGRIYDEVKQRPQFIIADHFQTQAECQKPRIAA